MTTLLALSDVVVLRALERCATRTLSGEARRHLLDVGTPRHRAYEHMPIVGGRQTHALEDAWSFAPELVARWRLDVAAYDWTRVLDRYVRSLLTSQSPHTLPELERALSMLGINDAA